MLRPCLVCPLGAVHHIRYLPVSTNMLMASSLRSAPYIRCYVNNQRPHTANKCNTSCHFLSQAVFGAASCADWTMLPTDMVSEAGLALCTPLHLLVSRKDLCTQTNRQIHPPSPCTHTHNPPTCPPHPHTHNLLHTQNLLHKYYLQIPEIHASHLNTICKSNDVLLSVLNPSFV